MTVTGDINVTTGNIKIGTGGDVIFNTCCKLDASTTLMQILPEADGTDINFGSSANRWEDMRVYASEDISFYCNSIIRLDAGGNVEISGDDVLIQPGGRAADQIIVYIPEGSLDAGADGARKVAYRLYASGTGNNRYLKVVKN